VVYSPKTALRAPAATLVPIAVAALKAQSDASGKGWMRSDV
jgi:hypothetical protein